jgi:hypothetical protein
MATHLADQPTHSHEVVPFDYFKRISWGAIFAGTLVAIVLEITLSLLGVGIGLGIVNPATDENPLGTIGLGAGIWMALSALISLFAGGWIAGRFAGFPRKYVGALHGITVWGLASLVSFFLMTTAMGSLISGVAGAVGKGISLVGTEAMRSGGVGAASQTSPEAREAAKNMLAGKPATEADREALINQLVNTGMSREEAERSVDASIQQYNQLRQGGAANAAEKAMDALSKAAFIAFIALVLGAIAAAYGGIVGIPREALPVHHTEGARV